MSREAKIAINVLVVAGAVGLGLYLTREPWQIYRQQRTRANAIESDMRAKEAERVDVAKRLAELDSPAGRESQAREHDFVKPGEQPIGR